MNTDQKAATLDALAWAAGELAENQAICVASRRPLVFSLVETRDFLPVLIRLAQQELARRSSAGRPKQPIETLTPGAAAVRRHREKKKAQQE